MPTYKIHSGIHVEKDVQYYKGGPDGDVFESEADLLRHNVKGCPPRFELLGDSADGLEARNVQQLRALAKVEGIDLGAASRKDDIVAAIRGMRAIRGPKVEAAQPA
jgi:hypothetical protein